MPKASVTWIDSYKTAYATLRAGAAPTTSYVASDWVDAFWFDRAVLMVRYVKGDTTSLEIRPEVSINGDAVSPVWDVGVSIDTQATTGSTITVTEARDEYTSTHSGAGVTDVDNLAFDLYELAEIPLNAPSFRVSVKVTGATTNSPLVAVWVFFSKVETFSEKDGLPYAANW